MNHKLFNQLAYYSIAEMPFGRQLRQHLVDPVRLHGNSVVWRNYEASRDVGALEPRSRDSATYVLQEYFVPVRQFGKFVTKITEVLQGHHANILNISIRHAMPDRGSLMAWAREEVFAFVIYYKQGTTEHEKTMVGVWTRKSIDAALSLGGTYYLPYQLHATQEQFHQSTRPIQWPRSSSP